VQDVREQVYTQLHHLGSLDDLRRLFIDTLNYSYANVPGSLASLPSPLQEHITDLRLIASHNGFSIFYACLDSLSRSLERAILQRLWTSDFCGLFVFSDTGQQIWEFVNAKYVGRRRRILRRMVVSPEERLRTAAERIALLDMANIATPTALAIQAQHDRAFDVEAVTRRFFEDYKRVFGKLQNEFLFPHTKDPVWAHDFALQLLNRLMFLYFIQRKRWLGNDPNFMRSLWEAYKRSGQPKDSFYQKWLSVLFFEAFCEKFQAGRSDRQHLPSEIRDALAKAPYLNGGLFTPNELDTRYSFTVPDSFFEVLFDKFDDQSPGFLERYNFTIREDTPFDQEVAVDPEMIGKVYESLVNITFEGLSEEDLRGSAGIFYTQRVEIDLMCRLALVDWLSNQLGQQHKPLLYQVIFAYEPDEKEEADQAVARENLWPRLTELLHEVTLLDPACGSGSFLVGMLSILDDIEARANAQLGISETSYERRKRVIGKNLYGVDVMPWAVRVAELRLWLQLAIETAVHPAELKFRPLLPNFSFKLRAGDSLVQEIGGINFALHRSHLDIPAPLKGRLTHLKGEKLKFYNNDPSAQFKSESVLKQEELHLLREILNARIHTLQNKVKLLESRLETARIQQGEFPGLAGERRRQASLDEVRLQQELEQTTNRLVQAQKARDALVKAEDVPFVWDIAFVEVFEGEKGGFDIVIGNPPYVAVERIEDPQERWEARTYKEKLQSSVAAAYPAFFGYKPSGQQRRRLDGRSDYYVYFYLHGLSLLNPQGSFCFITSNSWLDVEYGKDLQEFLLKHSQVKMMLDNLVKKSFVQDINTIIVLLAAPDERSEQSLETSAGFVMFKVPFEEAMHPVIFQEIEEAKQLSGSQHYRQLRVPMFGTTQTLVVSEFSCPEFRMRVVKQRDLYTDGLEGAVKTKLVSSQPTYLGGKWGGKYLRAPEVFWTILQRGKDKLVRLGDLAKVLTVSWSRQGQNATLMSSKSQGRPKEKVIEVLKSPKDVSKIPLRRSDTHYFLKLKEWVKGHLVYAPIVWVDIRGDKHICHLCVEAIPFTHNFHGIHPENSESTEELCAILNSQLSWLCIEALGRRGLGGGAVRVLVDDLRLHFPVLNPSALSSSERASLVDAFHQMANREVKSVFEELGLRPTERDYGRIDSADISLDKVLPDRRELDRVVFEALGLTEQEQLEVYRAVVELVKNRLVKAGSI